MPIVSLSDGYKTSNERIAGFVFGCFAVFAYDVTGTGTNTK